MKGDFTRFTHDPSKHYTGVLKQQGRVDLDADWNEQVAIQEHLDRTEAQDVIGPCGVPKTGGGFLIGVTGGWDDLDLTISPGRIYVDGILCELEDEASYLHQPDYYPDPPTLEPQESRTDLVYLDVWQRHITAIEDPDIREVALGGPDTATRVKTVWQVKVLEGVVGETYACRDSFPGWEEETAPSGGRLSTRAVLPPADEGPCIIAPGGGYRGLENRLYRVEIHEGSDGEAGPTFKWSRDNGSVVFAVEEFVSGELEKVRVRRLGKDQVLALRVGDWVEMLDDAAELAGEPGTLAQIVPDGIDETERILTLDRPTSGYDLERHPKVRRWDQGSDAIPVTAEADFIELEDGIQVQFSGDNFKTGDYWVFAARAVPGTVEELVEAPPRGIEHHYCRLALITWQREQGQRYLVSITEEGEVEPDLAKSWEVYDDGWCWEFELIRVVETPDVDFNARMVCLILHENREKLTGYVRCEHGKFTVRIVLEYPNDQLLQELSEIPIISGSEEWVARVKDCRREFPPLTDLPAGGEGCCTAVVYPGDDIQAALDALPEYGGCVCLKAGTHTITEPIRVEKSNVVLRGESLGARVERENGVNMLVVSGPNEEQIANITVDGIQFVANLGEPVAHLDIEIDIEEDVAVILDGCQNAAIMDCGIQLGHPIEIIGRWIVGILILDSTDIKIHKNRIDQVGIGILETLGRNLEVLENTITGPVFETEDGTVIPVGLWGVVTGYPKFPAWGSMPYTAHSGSRSPMAHYGATMGVEGEGRPCIKRNMIENYRAGIWVVAARSTIAGNKVLQVPLWAAEGGESYGIHIDAPHCVIQENYIENYPIGIYGSVTAHHSIIERNDLNLADSSCTGILVAGAYAVIDGNNIHSEVLPAGEDSGDGPFGIHLKSESKDDPDLLPDHGVIRCNTLTGWQSAIWVSGISVELGVSDVQILENRVGRPDDAGDIQQAAPPIGITVVYAHGAIVAANKIDDARYCGIGLVKGTGGLITRNSVAGGPGIGIGVMSANDVIISENKVEKIGVYGIAGVKSTDVALSNNRVAWCGYALLEEFEELPEEFELLTEFLGTASVLFSQSANISLESCEVLHTGTSRDGQSTYQGNIYGILLHEVEGDVHVYANRIVGITDPNELDLDACHMSFSLSGGPVKPKNPTCVQFLDNTVIGVGGPWLVRLLGDVKKKFIFANNRCEHVTVNGTGLTPSDESPHRPLPSDLQLSTVWISGNHSVVMGNQIQADNPECYSFGFKANCLTAVGNVTSGLWTGVPENAKPTPVDDFNHIGVS